jgi:hypothetical protein
LVVAFTDCAWHSLQGSVEDIIVALERDGSEWATHTRQALAKLSPTALKVLSLSLSTAPCA